MIVGAVIVGGARILIVAGACGRWGRCPSTHADVGEALIRGAGIAVALRLKVIGEGFPAAAEIADFT
jgi:hypothetical protein